MSTTQDDTRTFTRAEVESIVEQIKAISLDGAPVFVIDQNEEDLLASIYVRIAIPDGCARWFAFKLDPWRN